MLCCLVEALKGGVLHSIHTHSHTPPATHPPTPKPWLRTRSVLWLLRFPPYGEANIRLQAAAQGVDPGRIIFTDVANKDVHIR